MFDVMVLSGLIFSILISYQTATCRLRLISFRSQVE